MHVCRIGPGLRGCRAGVCGSGQNGLASPRPRTFRRDLIGGGCHVAGVIVCLHPGLGGRCGVCRVRITRRGLLGHSRPCCSHGDFGGACLVAAGLPCPLMCVVVCAGAPAVVVEFLRGSHHARGAPTALISVSPYMGLPMVCVVPVWWRSSSYGTKLWRSLTPWFPWSQCAR